MGDSCQINWDIEKLNIDKGPTGLFEWYLSVKFSDINKIMSKLAKNQRLIMTRQKDYSDCFLDETNIRSVHFNNDLFVEMINRRAARLISNIKSDQFLLFIRYENEAYITMHEDIELFNSYIHEINPNCNYKLLLFKANDINPTLKAEHLIHRDRKDKEDLSDLAKILSELITQDTTRHVDCNTEHDIIKNIK